MVIFAALADAHGYRETEEDDMTKKWPPLMTRMTLWMSGVYKIGGDK